MKAKKTTYFVHMLHLAFSTAALIVKSGNELCCCSEQQPDSLTCFGALSPADVHGTVPPSSV